MGGEKLLRGEREKLGSCWVKGGSRGKFMLIFDCDMVVDVRLRGSGEYC